MAFPRDVDVEESGWAAWILDAEDGALPMDIHTAASLGDEQVVVEALHGDPALALTRNDLGWSPLMFAVWQGHEGLLAALLEAAGRCGHDATDGSVGRLPKSGRTLLMVASRFGHLRIATRLCKPKALEMRDFRGQTALFHAVRGGNEDLIRMLVSQGANVNACDNQGQSVLKLSERCRPPATCIMLQKAGAKLEPLPAVSRPTSASDAEDDQKGTTLGLHLNLAGILEGLSLQKYLSLFQIQGIDLPLFLAMNEEDLKRAGVSLLGPRRKMAMEIDRIRSLLGISNA